MKKLPLLPLRDIVVFPHMMVPLYVGRATSISAVEEAMRGNREILLAAQKKAKTDAPSAEDIYTIGTVGQIMQHINPNTKILCHKSNREEFVMKHIFPIVSIF